MTRHSNPTTNVKDKDNDFQIEKNIMEETVVSKINHALPCLPFSNGDLETKLSESDAKISKLISEIDLLKKKVSWLFDLFHWF